MTSSYDELYKRLFGDLPAKSGTAYEQLMARVAKVLHERHIVIHDMRLAGTSTVKHQIDVTIEKHGTRQRTLIECKDFDKAGSSVGLAIVRDFWGVVEDVKPDLAIVITCNDFTKDARIYAKSKGIKLGILRMVQERDMAFRIGTIVLNMHVVGASNVNPQLGFTQQYSSIVAQQWKDEGLGSGIHSDDPVYIYERGEKMQAIDFINAQVSKSTSYEPGHVELELKGLQFEIGSRGQIPLDALKITFDVTTDTISAISSKTAALILDDLEGTDLVISQEDLQRFEIDKETGEAVQKGKQGPEKRDRA